MIQFFLILSFLLYPIDGFQIFDFWGYGVKFTDVTLLLLYAVVLKKLIWDGEQLKINFNIGVQLSIVLLLFATLSGIYPLFDGRGIAITQYFKTLVHFVYIYLFVLLSFSYKFKADDWKNVIKALLIFSIFVNIFGIYQMFARAFDLPLAWLELNNISMSNRGKLDVSEISQLSIQFMNLYRATSIFTEPSVYSAFNTMIFIFVAVPFIQKKQMFLASKWLNITIFLLVILGLVATFSLTALLAFVGILCGILIFEKRRYLKNLLIGLIIALPVLLLADAAVEHYTETSPIGLFAQRVGGIAGSSKGVNKELSGESYSYRLQIIGTSIEIWEKSMFFGCGLGNFYLNQNKEISYAQDSFWSAVAETGILGAAAFAGLFIAIFYATFKIRKDKNYIKDAEQERLINIAFYVVIQLFFVNFFTTNNFIFVNLWFYVGMVMSIINQIVKQNTNNIVTISIVKVPLKEKVAISTK